LLKKCHPGLDPGSTLNVWCVLCTQSVDSRPPRRVVDFRGNGKKGPFFWPVRFSTDCYGFFAVLVVAPWLQDTFGFTTGVNVWNAGLLLAVMAVPTIISVAEDALSAVGRERREASYGLGATRAETLLKVVMPAARSGIVAAVLLGMMRAIGETMVVWMAAGMAGQIPTPWWDLSQSVRPITATIAQEMGETPQGSPHFYSLFALGLLLLVVTFVLNLVSEHFLSRARGGGVR
ncbi:MAG TPA: ABC transporter permease subunit, partial [Phycisphaerales bacterium]|nr:ABC transporter permease subunit [Phycisphaerales bacterium]